MSQLTLGLVSLCNLKLRRKEPRHCKQVQCFYKTSFSKGSPKLRRFCKQPPFANYLYGTILHVTMLSTYLIKINFIVNQ